MTEEKTVKVELKARPTIVVNLATPDGEAKLTFTNLKQNKLMKLQVDISKSSDWSNMVLELVKSVENLSYEGEPVTLEQIHTGEVAPELAGAIIKAFFMVNNARVATAEAEVKKENEGSDSVPA